MKIIRRMELIEKEEKGKAFKEKNKEKSISEKKVDTIVNLHKNKTVIVNPSKN